MCVCVCVTFPNLRLKILNYYVYELEAWYNIEKFFQGL